MKNTTPTPTAFVIDTAENIMAMFDPTIDSPMDYVLRIAQWDNEEWLQATIGDPINADVRLAVVAFVANALAEQVRGG